MVGIWIGKKQVSAEPAKNSLLNILLTKIRIRWLSEALNSISGHAIYSQGYGSVGGIRDASKPMSDISRYL